MSWLSRLAGQTGLLDPAARPSAVSDPGIFAPVSDAGPGIGEEVQSVPASSSPRETGQVAPARAVPTETARTAVSPPLPVSPAERGLAPPLSEAAEDPGRAQAPAAPDERAARISQVLDWVARNDRPPPEVPTPPNAPPGEVAPRRSTAVAPSDTAQTPLPPAQNRPGRPADPGQGASLPAARREDVPFLEIGPPYGAGAAPAPAAAAPLLQPLQPAIAPRAPSPVTGLASRETPPPRAVTKIIEERIDISIGAIHLEVTPPRASRLPPAAPPVTPSPPAAPQSSLRRRYLRV